MPLGAKANRPLFVGEHLVRMSGLFLMWVQGCVELPISFVRLNVIGDAVKACGVVPNGPFKYVLFKLNVDFLGPSTFAASALCRPIFAFSEVVNQGICHGSDRWTIPNPAKRSG